MNVTFKNADRSEEIVYSLARKRSAWKIADIKYENGESLLKYFEEGQTNKQQ